MRLRSEANSKSPPTAIDLFSGCGGLTLGLKNAGFRVLAAVEIDDTAAATFRANHPEIRLEHTDIRRLPAATLLRKLGIKRGELDLLAGCPPCQGFSSIRTRNGSHRSRDRRNNLVREMLRFARAFMPRAIMMENVPGLRQRKPLLDLCRGLKKLGFRVAVDIKDAANFGVPQRRKRLILLAGRGFSIPFAEMARSTRTVRKAIGDLPKPSNSRDALHRLPERRAPRIQALIKAIPKNGGSRADLPLHQQLKCHQTSDGFSDVYGRIAWDDVAPTITSGCFNPSKGRFLHPVQDRAISLREAALLQGFPRSYRFEMSAGKEAIALMIGNALPPEFIRRHAVVIGAALKGQNKRPKRQAPATR